MTAMTAMIAMHMMIMIMIALILMGRHYQNDHFCEVSGQVGVGHELGSARGSFYIISGPMGVNFRRKCRTIKCQHFGILLTLDILHLKLHH